MKCPECQFDNLEDAKFCNECGNKLDFACPECGKVNAFGSKFCNECGQRLDEAVEKEEKTPTTDSERKQVTVLFSDLTGYTALAERLDPEDTREILEQIFRGAAEIVERYGGRIEKFIGDAIVGVFGIPDTHEDDPVRAVRAALEFHRHVETVAPGLVAKTGTPITVHSGINTGLVVTGELQLGRATAGPVGDTVNLAARIMSEAPAGEIWLGPLTRKLTAYAVKTEYLGPHELKGKSEPVTLARVTGLTEREVHPGHRRSRFIGRQAELVQLLNAVESVRNGVGGAFAIRAEAGGGKSRLFEEFRAQLGDDVQWLEGRAYSYAEKIPYIVVIDLLNRALRIEEDDAKNVVRGKLTKGLSPLVTSPEDVLPVVGLLYEIDFGGAPVDKEAFEPRLLEVIREFLATLIGWTLTVLCIQDLHWADASSVALIRALAADEALPLVLALNFRPGFELGVDRVQTLDLPGLSGRQTRELVASMLGDTDPPEELLSFIETRTDGNPFFAEELVHSLIETGVLAREDGSWNLTTVIDKVGIPTTIQGVLSARIDRLDERRRRILREASVVGRQFLFEIVRRVRKEEDGLEDALEDLTEADLIWRKAEAEYLEYVFKHALTQEVAYEGLLKRERSGLHARVGAVMEELLQDRIDEYVETLAYHFSRGGIAIKAAQYLNASGLKAFERHALEEADGYYREAYTLLAESEPTSVRDRLLAEALIGWTDVRTFDMKVVEIEALLQKHWDEVERTDEPELIARYRAAMALPRWMAIDFHTADTLAADAIQRGRAHGVVEAEAWAGAWRTWALMSLGRLEEAIEVGEQAIVRAAELPENHDAVYYSRANLAVACIQAGKFSRSRELLAEMLDLASRLGNSRPAASARACGSFQSSLLLDPEAAIAEAGAGLDVVLDPVQRSWCLGYLAIGQNLDRQYDAAKATLVRHTEHHLERPVEYCESAIRFQVGTIALVRGDLSRGMDAMLRELELARSTDHTMFQILWLGYLGVIYVRIVHREIVPHVMHVLRNVGFVLRHAIPARRNARRCLEEARALAEGIGAGGWEGLIAFSLARLHELSRRPDDTREELERCLGFLERSGVTRLPNEVQAFADGLS